LSAKSKFLRVKQVKTICVILKISDVLAFEFLK